MSQDPGPTRNGPPNSKAVAPGLPTVEPPSGKHILQMFLVPGVIVALIVGVVIGFVWLFGGPRTPEQWLKQLRDPNPDVRWKAAADLAQHLLRDPDLSSDADFALQLAGFLDDARENSAAEEKAIADRLTKITDKEAREKELQKIQGEGSWKSLDADRKTIMYLGACLGNFRVPVGVPLLKQMAEQETGMEPNSLAAQRWRAVFALANLGQRLGKDYPALPDVRKDLIETRLDKALKNPRLAKWAAPALENVKSRRAGTPEMMGLDGTFEKITEPGTSDPFLRELVALALNFWTGTDAENDRMDRLLLRLTNDSGGGGDVLTELTGQDPAGFTVPNSVSGLEVSYLANRALANRGSRLVRLPMFLDMLDEDYLRTTMKVRRKDGTEVTDQNAVVQTLIDSLKALEQLHRKRPGMDLSSLRKAIDTLADHSNAAAQAEAKKLQMALDTN
jgi:HEAT repeat protein